MPAPDAFAPAPSGPTTPLDRRALRDARRRARHVRRLYALAGLVVLAAFFAATVVVVMSR